MAVTISSLRVAYPEFTNCPDSMLTSAIASATLRCDEEVLASHYDLAVMLLACHYAASSPFGIDLRLGKNGNETTYFLEWERIAKAAGRAYRWI